MERYDLFAGNDIENVEDNQTVSEVAAPNIEEVLAIQKGWIDENN